MDIGLLSGISVLMIQRFERDRALLRWWCFLVPGVVGVCGSCRIRRFGCSATRAHGGYRTNGGRTRRSDTHGLIFSGSSINPSGKVPNLTHLPLYGVVR